MSYDGYEIPDGITPLVGFRGWLVKDGKLWSVYPDIRAVEWPVAGPLQSECLPPTKRTRTDDRSGTPLEKHYWTPHMDCTCGIYALHAYPREQKDYEGGRMRAIKPWPKEAITGMIHGWGRIVVGDKGFRAQYAKPIALITTSRSKRYPLFQELAYTYGLEIITPQEARK